MSNGHHRPIVVGIDGSPSALAAARWAATTASLQHRPLRFVHAYGVPLAYTTSITDVDGLRKAMTEQGQEWLEDARQAVAADGPVPELAAAEVGAGVLLTNETKSAAMLVLGGRESGGIAGLLVGSTAAAVVGHAHCPVVVVRGEVSTAGAIVLGVDGTTVGETAIGFAFAEAAARGRDLVAVHTWTDTLLNEFLQVGSTLAIGPARDEAKELLAERLAGWQEKYPDVKVTRVVTHERPVPELLRQASGAVMVVVGTRGRGGFPGLMLGSTSQQLLHHSPCPVAVVPTGTDTR